MAKILVIDDEPDEIELLKDRLTINNFEVIAALDGDIGFNMAKVYQPDLILLDILMPGLDGFKVLKLLKGTEKTRDIPVIVVSAKSEAKDLDRGLQLGAVAYIIKPYNAEELLRTISAYILNR
ncbi:MAG: response regulator [Candidatus Omnitrophica bacterium]|nr:response regulator [Candidatus Omnitrophota bacterium]